MVIFPYGSAADNIERRLRGQAALDGTRAPVTAEEIIAAVSTGTGRRAARLLNWGANALRRIGANAEALAMERRAEAASRGASAPTGSGAQPATPDELAEAGL